MNKINNFIAIVGLVAAGVLSGNTPVNAAAECQVSGDYGSFTINSNNTVTGRFSISGDPDCEPAEVSIAVWECVDSNCGNLRDQIFFGGSTDDFGYVPTQTNQAYATANITTGLPTDDEHCKLQIDLVRGGQRADSSHPYPDGPFYDERRMSAIVVDNPACREVETVTETVTETVVETVEVPGETVVVTETVEVPSEPEVVTVTETVEVPAETGAKELPKTGPAETLSMLGGTGALGQATRMYLRSRKNLALSLFKR